MARRPAPDDLLFTDEVAKLLGFAYRNNIHRLEGLEPIKMSRGCKIYWRPDVMRYKRERERRR